MQAPPSPQAQIAALDLGEGVLHPDGWTLVEVSGTDALGWLNDLVTADVAGLSLAGTVRSLLLGPTGRIRADLLVQRLPQGLLLLQPPGQPRPIDELLAPYVLSSDVAIGRSTAIPTIVPAHPGPWSVSATRSGGVPVSAEALESWRIRCGVARFPIDLGEDSLPAEAGLDEAPVVDRNKGCYLGQESVAKIRNLGHPTRVVVAVQGPEPIAVGQAVTDPTGPVGVVTSVDALGGGRAAIARIRWEARDAALMTDGGTPLTLR